jgi:hypothetical protein
MRLGSIWAFKERTFDVIGYQSDATWVRSILNHAMASSKHQLEHTDRVALKVARKGDESRHRSF